MEAVGAPRSYAARATGPLIDARCWSAWVSAAGQTQGLILCRCRRADRGSSVRFAASDLHTHDAGAMLPSGPS